MSPICAKWLFLILVTFGSCGNTVRVLGEQSKEDTGHFYFTELIKLALKKSENRFPHKTLVILNDKSITQGRTLNLLEKKFVDIFWVGTNKKREQRFRPIRIPLFYGLLGYRVSIIHKDNLALFNSITKQPDKLKNLTACQGQHWPDSDILSENGYSVFRVARFELMFKMLSFKRCDYFPRAIFEGYSELDIAKQQHPDLVMFDQILLHYPFAMYFFIHKDNEELAKQIEYGLNRAVDDGSLLDFIKKHSISRKLFPLSKWQSKTFLHLDNNDLSDKTKSLSSKYWLSLY